MLTTLRLILSFLGSSFLLWTMTSCGDGSTKSSIDGESNQLAADIDQLIHDLPTPTKVPHLLHAADANFHQDALNDLTKLSVYITNEDEAALNLGIYLMDMGYLIAYNQLEEAAQYLEACQQLAERLNISSVFSPEVMDKFHSNSTNPDTLNSLFHQSILDVERELKSTNRVTVPALVLAGSFIEELYLAIEVIESYPKDGEVAARNQKLEPLVKVVLEQQSSLQDVTNLLKDLPDDEIIGHMVSELAILRVLYATDMEKVQSESPTTVLTTSALSGIRTEVKRIRTDIVEFE